MQNKILIIGISGTGKSYLARLLSQKFGIPVTHYDQLVWEKNWTEVAENIVAEKIHAVLKKDAWIIEGYIEPCAKEKIEAADIVIYLDYSGLDALIGGLKRWWQCRGRVRPEMAEGCIETFDWNFLKRILLRDERPNIETAIKGFEHKVIRFHSRNELKNHLRTIVI